MNPYKIYINSITNHSVNDFIVVEKNVFNDVDKIKIIIKDIKLSGKTFQILIDKDDTTVFRENIDVENNNSTNVKISFESVKDSDEIICKYIWIYI